MEGWHIVKFIEGNDMVKAVPDSWIFGESEDYKCLWPDTILGVENSPDDSFYMATQKAEMAKYTSELDTESEFSREHRGEDILNKRKKEKNLPYISTVDDASTLEKVARRSPQFKLPTPPETSIPSSISTQEEYEPQIIHKVMRTENPEENLKLQITCSNDKTESGLPNNCNSETSIPSSISTQEEYEPQIIQNSNKKTSTVSNEKNIDEENPTAVNFEMIEIIDDLGNVINNIHDLHETIQNEWKEQPIIVLTETQKNEEEDQPQEDIEGSKQKPRKRKLKPAEWKLNVRKKKCQSGEQYVNVRGKVVKARSLQNKKNCLQNCKFNCAKQISQDERKQAFNSYWSSTQNEKYLFLRNTTKKAMKGRKTTGDNVSRRCYSFTYFIQVKGGDIRVCKKYFLGTFDISQKPVYTAHLEPNEIKKDNRGKQSEESAKKEEIMTHIKSFPVIDSHYCRQNTKRKYLEANLSVAKMYGLYTKWCHDNDTTAAKLSYYRHIFTTEFNYGFHVPEQDRGIRCESFKIKNEENTLAERNKDRERAMEKGRPETALDEATQSENGEVFVIQVEDDEAQAPNKQRSKKHTRENPPPTAYKDEHRSERKRLSEIAKALDNDQRYE
ncbi:unnamed protein product [Phaedon cochleariae]|uniref:Uncharacterized protein n=1 Tax=Phaedon cochleariae TaxID=80249 RepID=A0A9N9X4Y1_PHACE|nr:unnamed protein product [Phaedon cochleariae]